MQPKVSIQIPTYNQAAYIKRTIESCLMQDYSNIEINIADDNSTDGSFAIIEPFLKDKRVNYYKNESNIGRVKNYHKALYEYASGEWAINLDGDDYFTEVDFVSNAIQNIFNYKNDNVLIFQGNHNIKKIAALLPEHKWINEENILVNGQQYFLHYPEILNFTHCATLYNRRVAMELNFYSFDCLFTDFNSLSKLFLRGSIILSSKNVAFWQQHNFNQSATLDHKKIKAELAAFDEVSVFAEKYLSVKKAQLWNRKMKTFLLSIYVDMQHTPRGKVAGIKYLFLHFSFKKMHLRQLAKAFINVTKGKSTKTKDR